MIVSASIKRLCNTVILFRRTPLTEAWPLMQQKKNTLRSQAYGAGGQGNSIFHPS
jgi:hypothetical protein